MSSIADFTKMSAAERARFLSEIRAVEYSGRVELTILESTQLTGIRDDPIKVALRAKIIKGRKISGKWMVNRKSLAMWAKGRKSGRSSEMVKLQVTWPKSDLKNLFMFIEENLGLTASKVDYYNSGPREKMPRPAEFLETGK